MPIGDIRELCAVEQYTSGAWAGYANAWMALLAEPEDATGQRYYLARARWSTELAQLIGVTDLTQNFRVVWVRGNVTHYLTVVSVVDPDMRRRELSLRLVEAANDEIG